MLPVELRQVSFFLKVGNLAIRHSHSTTTTRWGLRRHTLVHANFFDQVESLQSFLRVEQLTEVVLEEDSGIELLGCLLIWFYLHQVCGSMSSSLLLFLLRTPLTLFTIKLTMVILR